MKNKTTKDGGGIMGNAQKKEDGKEVDLSIWNKPKTGITSVEIAFGPKNVLDYMPKYGDVPGDYEGRREFERLQRTWFYIGIDASGLPRVKDGINQNDAWNHLRCIQASFQPKHEHKEAGVAWLMSLWFETPKDNKEEMRKKVESSVRKKIKEEAAAGKDFFKEVGVAEHEDIAKHLYHKEENKLQNLVSRDFTAMTLDEMERRKEEKEKRKQESKRNKKKSAKKKKKKRSSNA